MTLRDRQYDAFSPSSTGKICAARSPYIGVECFPELRFCWCHDIAESTRGTWTMTPQDERLFITWFTSAADQSDHAITDYEAGHAIRGGTDPQALCGHTVTPVSLTAPPGARCGRCQARVRARVTPHPSHRPRASRCRDDRKRSWLLRLFSHISPTRSLPDVCATGPSWAANAAALSPTPPSEKAAAHHASGGRP